jgi:hypothetical protein
MKIRANKPPLYSTLNPDTSSDSPSAKSNGVRFVSARFVINHITHNGNIISITHDFRLNDIYDISMVMFAARADNKIIDIETSYEIV